MLIVKIGGGAVGNGPALLGGILLVVVGVQLMSLGLIAELIVHFRRDRAPDVLRGRTSGEPDRRVPPVRRPLAPGRERRLRARDAARSSLWVVVAAFAAVVLQGTLTHDFTTRPLVGDPSSHRCRR